MVTKIWNREGAFRFGILFEYKGEKAYKDCQNLLEKHILPHFKNLNTKVVGSRDRIMYEFLKKIKTMKNKVFGKLLLI